MIDSYSPELAAAIKEKTDGCPEDCIFDDYHVSSSTTQLHLGDHDDMHSVEVRDDSTVHSAIHFYYPSFSYTIIKNHPPSLVKWLSNEQRKLFFLYEWQIITKWSSIQARSAEI